jgi:NADPH:quinone reductase-like Zn-dependent oxidoreductase
MKAILVEEYGGPEVLQLKEIDKPECGSNQVLVKVRASTVNRTDCAILRAKPAIMRLIHGLGKPNEPIPGTDFSGKIEAVGNDVQSFKPGDKVFGFDDAGLASKAEYLVLEDDDNFSIMPEGISYAEAAASIEGAHYAYNFLNKVKLEEGDDVIVNGASGAIGSALVQLLSYEGANVTAVCNTKNLDLISSLGASRVIDYTKEDFTQIEENFDYVFDAVGKSTFLKCRPLLNQYGIYISSELGPYNQNPFLAIITTFFSGKKVKFPFPYDVNRSIDHVKKLFTEGKYKPVIDRTYPLEEISEAYRYVETGEKTGNVVITMNSSE